MELRTQHRGALLLLGHHNQPVTPQGTEHQLPNNEGAAEDVAMAAEEV